MRDIENYAYGLSKEEVCAIFYRTYDDLSHDERQLFDAAYSRGRAIAKQQAVSCLFSQMTGKEGIKGTLAYLVRFGDEWPEVTDEGNTKEGHMFKVVLQK